jgi:predicted permease
MTLRQYLTFALIGWIAGIALTLVVGLIIFPAVVGGAHVLSAGPDLLILAIVLLLISPAALAGGVVGSRLPEKAVEAAKYSWP